LETTSNIINNSVNNYHSNHQQTKINNNHQQQSSTSMSAKASKGKTAMLAAVDATFKTEMAAAIEALTGLKPGADEDGMYLIKEIICRKTAKDTSFLYLISWLGWGEADNSWEPYENLNEFARQHVIDRWCSGTKPRSFVGQYDHELLDHFILTTKTAHEAQALRKQAEQAEKKSAKKKLCRRSKY
jgi:Chromo (CHRromatin Organisation MOdifier) domain